MYRRLIVVFFLLNIIFVNQTNASPWFTGPLLAPAGHNVPAGHTNLELYGFDINTDGVYDEQKRIRKLDFYKSVIFNPIITHGFTDWLDIQLATPYMYNASRGSSYAHIADTALAFGIQLWEQNESTKSLDIRLLIQETFPTGRFNSLSPLKHGTESTGLGARQTQVGLNLQYLVNIYNEHYLRSRAVISHTFSNPVDVEGLNSYGGTKSTIGKIKRGDENYLDIAFEYTLSQNWVAVMEGVVANGQATRFNGILTIGNIGGPAATIGNNSYKGKSLAPALEYNFSDNLGFIGGVWFPFAGNNTAHYMTYVLALNAYW